MMPWSGISLIALYYRKYNYYISCVISVLDRSRLEVLRRCASARRVRFRNHAPRAPDLNRVWIEKVAQHSIRRFRPRDDAVRIVGFRVRRPSRGLALICLTYASISCYICRQVNPAGLLHHVTLGLQRPDDSIGLKTANRLASEFPDNE